MAGQLKFSIGTGRHASMGEIAGLAKVAEECGFSEIGFLDDIVLTRDVYVMLAAAAIATTTLHVGTCVTHPYTRHPAQTAVAIASLHELSGGRAYLGLGAGHLHKLIGMKAAGAKIADVREAIEVARGLSRGEEVTLQNGTKISSPWMKDPFPIYVGTEGPKSLELAGELADGVWITGLDPIVTRWRLEYVARGAEKAKRSRSDMKIWQRATVVLTDEKDRARGRDEARGFIATLAHQFSMAVLERDNPDSNRLKAMLPQSTLDEYDQIRQAWDPYEHEKYDAKHGAAISDDLVDAHAIIGPAEYCVERLQALVDEFGFDGIALSAWTIRDVPGLMREFQKGVMPKLQMASVAPT